MTRPTLAVAYPGETIEADDWNDNFNDTLDYIEEYLPSQTNNAGKVLTTNGTATSWGNAPATVYVAKTNIPTGSSQTITLADNITLYISTVSANTTYTFSTANLTPTELNSKVVTFELLVTMASTKSLTFPSSVSWLNAETPSISSAGSYLFAFRTVDGGTTWIGNLQGKV